MSAAKGGLSVEHNGFVTELSSGQAKQVSCDTNRSTLLEIISLFFLIVPTGIAVKTFWEDFLTILLILKCDYMYKMSFLL